MGEVGKSKSQGIKKRCIGFSVFSYKTTLDNNFSV